MLKLKPVLVFILSALCFTACTKINDSTELGGDLIPTVDNINTFEAILDVESDNRFLYGLDSTEISFSDFLGFGQLNDPEFGTTTAQTYFNLYKFPITADDLYPFIKPADSITIDSVVLSMAYVRGYGDTTVTNTIEVYEISPSSAFADSAFYRLNHSPDFALGPLLGTKSYKITDLDDSVIVKFPSDTITRKFANVIRVRLDNNNNFFGNKIRQLPANVFRPDAFRQIVKGLSIKATAGNSITYINERASVVYIHYRATVNGKDSASVTAFAPYQINRADPNVRRLGKAMIIKRNAAGGLATYGASGGNDPFLHIQSAPGSISFLSIPALSTFQNALIHRAELIFSRVPSAGDNTFSPPPFLLLDHVGNQGPATFYRDMQIANLGSDLSKDSTKPIIISAYNALQFGGFLRANSTYNFEITRYVQGIVTRKTGNDILRLHAPLRTLTWDSTFISPGYQRPARMNVNEFAGLGRVVIAGGTHPDPARRPRLRIIYSKL